MKTRLRELKCSVSCCEILAPTSEIGQAHGQGCCAGGRAGSQCQRDWIGTWTQAMVPHCTGKLCTAATIAPLDCGPKKPEPRHQMLQPCPRKLRPVVLAGVLMKFAESCVIEQHIDSLLKGVEPTNLGLGTPDAAALIVRIVRRWVNDMAWHPRRVRILENVFGRAFRSTCLEAARSACSQRAAICATQWGACDTGFWHRCDDGWTVDGTTRGGWQGSRAMQVMFVLGLEFALSKTDELSPPDHKDWPAG